MRALLLASIIAATSIGCGSKTEPAPAGSASTPTGEPATASGGATAEHRAADDKATEVEQAKGLAQAEVNSAKTTVEDAAAKLQKAARDKLQQSFDASDRKLTSLKEKAAKLTGTKKREADDAIADISVHEGTVMSGIASLRDATAAAWDAAKVQAEADLNALNNKVDALESSLN
ncbi:hypothetical protein BH11MYX3_BH11MYX3_03790 [soil metagenome]